MFRVAIGLGFVLVIVVGVITYFAFYHKSVNIVDNELYRVSALTDNISAFHRALDNILVPRVSGTQENAQVRKFIIDEMTSLGWHVDTDAFNAKVPIFGDITFANIIASHNHKAQRFLDLACHYDSKYFADFEFLGATDSAVPCSIMIQLAHSLNPLLNKMNDNMLSLRLIFFDGEEAFKNWSPTDSLYGSRHLAAKWHKTPYPEGGGDATQLDRIDMLVLLDLIGAARPTFYSFFSNTQGWYKVLTNVETKLAQSKVLQSYGQRYFLKMSTDSAIEDDHLPFLKRHVPVLHLISVPFPDAWHTKNDNRDIIDMTSTHNIIRILSVFVAEYLKLVV